MSAARLTDRWRQDLDAWAIPDEIMAQATESPWVLPRDVFGRRTDRYVEAPGGPSYEAAWSALDPPGTVLDVGAGAGAASLPLAARATAITAVDSDRHMLTAFAAKAEEMGVPVNTMLGRWPDIAAAVGLADVVTCHHVLYNVPDIEPFVRALTGHARRVVVMEITANHPMAWLNPLWRRLHGIERPTRPTAEDAVAILSSLGLEPRVQRWRRPASDYASFGETVEVTRRRLCLPPDRAGEVAVALRELGMDPEQAQHVGWPRRDLVTISWHGAA